MMVCIWDTECPMSLTLLCTVCAMPGGISPSSLLLWNVQVLLNRCTNKEKYAMKWSPTEKSSRQYIISLKRN